MNLDLAAELALSLMAQHGLKGWKLTGSDWRVQGGLCSRRKKTITLSRFVLQENNEAAVRELILHEIAHALSTGGHGPAFKAAARRLGCGGSSTIASLQYPKEDAKYRLYCTGCSGSWPRLRRPTRRLACKECCTRKWGKWKFDTQFILKVEEVKH